MAEDPLDKETSVSAEISPTGVKAAAKSRVVAAIDRLGGNLVDLMNIPLEERSSKRRSRMGAEREIVESVTNALTEKITTDREFAERAIEARFGKILRGQDNKDAVMAEALEDLRNDPPSPEESETGGETLSEEFMDRFEGYAGFATTDQLRQRWGRVLAAEVRKPGSFSSKVLRIVDEIDARTAAWFEEFCVHRLGSVVPKEFSGELEFNRRSRLVEADLLVEPGISGHVVNSTVLVFDNGTKWDFFSFGITKLGTPLGVAVEQGAKFTGGLVKSSNGKLQITIYMLTDVGAAVSTILPDLSGVNIGKLADRIAVDAAPAVVHEMWLLPNGIGSHRKLQMPAR